MTESRPWRTTLTFEAAASELQRCAGTQFDPALVASFCAFVYPDLLPGTDATHSAENPAADRACPVDVHTKAHTKTSDGHERSDALNPDESDGPHLTA